MGWTGVDLDGVLAEWHVPAEISSTVGDDAVRQIGKPVPKMVEQVKGWLAEGKDVRIMTARVAACGTRSSVAVDDQAFADDQRRLIEAWCREHLGQVLPVTATKDWQMIEFYDDRCVQMVTNTGESLQEQYDRRLEVVNQRLEEANEKLRVLNQRIGNMAILLRDPALGL